MVLSRETKMFIKRIKLLSLLMFTHLRYVHVQRLSQTESKRTSQPKYPEKLQSGGLFIFVLGFASVWIVEHAVQFQPSAEESHFYNQVANNYSTECGKVVAQPDFHIRNLVGILSRLRIGKEKQLVQNYQLSFPSV